MWLVNISGLTADRSHDEHPPRNSQTKGCESSGTSRPWCNWKRTPWAPGEATRMVISFHSAQRFMNLKELVGTQLTIFRHVFKSICGFCPQTWWILMDSDHSFGTSSCQGTKKAAATSERRAQSLPSIWRNIKCLNSGNFHKHRSGSQSHSWGWATFCACVCVYGVLWFTFIYIPWVPQAAGQTFFNISTTPY